MNADYVWHLAKTPHVICAYQRTILSLDDYSKRNRSTVKILYHLTVLPPKIPEAEALSQEITALRGHFEGDLLFLNPNPWATGPIPRLFFGWHKLATIRRHERTVDLHHFYNPDPYPFPLLRWLRRPVIYTITSGFEAGRVDAAYFNGLAGVTVPDERSGQRLAEAGVTNVTVIRPGIDTARFTYAPPPTDGRIRLMVGSAPWTEAQFASKGVDALLAAAAQEPRLNLVFLWRGVLAESFERRVQQWGVQDQVTVFNRLVDVNQVLAGVHGAITLADAPGIVKSYPHSLLDSLAAGKPVLVSRSIPMADYVAETGCGVVVETVDPTAILAGVSRLMAAYDHFQYSALQRGQSDFGLEAMFAQHRKLYGRAVT